MPQLPLNIRLGASGRADFKKAGPGSVCASISKAGFSESPEEQALSLERSLRGEAEVPLGAVPRLPIEKSAVSAVEALQSTVL